VADHVECPGVLQRKGARERVVERRDQLAIGERGEVDEKRTRRERGDVEARANRRGARA
jgi:hypothetical protein